MKIFLSYSNENNTTLIKHLSNDMTNHGYQVWTCLSENKKSSDELSISLGTQQKKIQTILLDQGQNLHSDDSIQTIDMCAWKQHYDDPSKSFRTAWYQEQLTHLLNIINICESESFIAKGEANCSPKSKQWSLHVAESLWDELIKVSGVVDQLSRYTLYELPVIMSQLSQKDRAHIVGGTDGWEDNSDLINQVCTTISFNKQNNLAKLWGALDLQLNAEL